MKKTLPILLMLVMAFLLAPAALAQEEAGADQGEADAVSSAFLTIDLEAGFALDPFFVSVNGGGETAASTFSEECTGYINADPTISVDWEGESDFLEAFFYSDHDPVMVIQMPDGEYLCNDDSNALLLDPVIEMTTPEKGTYHIWVGSFSPDQLIPGILVLTTRPEINVGTFSLGGLIQRESIPEDLVEIDEVQTRREHLADALAELEVDIVELKAGLEKIVTELTGDGEHAAFDIPLDGVICNGYISEEPDYVFDWEGEAEALRVFYEADGDATLLVVTPDGSVVCNDDHASGENLNPLVSIPTPAEGQYSVFVGHINPDEAVSGNLTVTELVELVPELLAPEDN
jgi:hypothetical protein